MLNRVLLRDASHGVWLDFAEPETVLVADRLDDVVCVLEQIEAHCRQGGYAAGYLSYEAAPAMDPAFACAEPEIPLAVFGLFASPRLSLEPVLPAADETAPGCGVWTQQEAFSTYADKICRIHQAIGAGQLYQVNYTLRLAGRSVSAPDLFRRIGLSAPYGAYLDLDSAAVVSGSPELFFRLDGDELESAPMKGTVARGQSAEEDERNRRWLRASEKNRAENLMITDMVRNDLGRIARTGSVRADALFDVQPLPTVWQMTSTIRARSDRDLPAVFRGLFPAASITGAPKVASMALISELEDGPRGIYTGTIGYLGPAAGVGDGLSGQFSVAIRTAWIDKADGRAQYGAGGGIVWDSSPEEEFAEAAIKARALSTAAPAVAADFELLETIGWSPCQGFDHLPLHLQRLNRAAQHFGFPLDLGQVRNCLEQAVAGVSADTADGRWRVRLCVAADGEITVSTAQLQQQDGPQPVMIARDPVRHDEPRLRFKTTERGLYERAAASVPPGVEALLWNDLGHLTESSIANLAYELDGRCYTPPLSDGVLPGVLREALIAEGQLHERSLPVAEASEVAALYLLNGLRGWRRAELLER